MNLIKKNSIDDAKTLYELHKQCFAENWNESSFRDMLADNHYFGFSISNLQKNKCGFVLCRRMFDEVEIITFCVLPEYRGHGFGKLLLNEVKKYISTTLKDAKIFLEVSKDNIVAISLYNSIGFKKIAERKKYYSTMNGLIAADIMVLEIKKSTS